MNRLRLLLAAATAVLVLAASTAIASAAEFSLANAGAVNSVSSGKLTFTAGSATVACNMTLALELLRGPIAKVEGAKIGTVTAVTWRECEGGELGAVLGLPWDITYRSIAGTLPSGVTGINLSIVRTQWLWRLLFNIVGCLYAGDLGKIIRPALIRGTTERYTFSSWRWDESTMVRYFSGPEACPSAGSWRGTANFSATQTLTRT